MAGPWERYQQQSQEGPWRRYAAQPEPEPQKEQRPGFMEFVNQGIAAGIGAPVDLITGGLNQIPGVEIRDPFGGSASIAGGMSALGIPVADPSIRPEGLGENVAAGLGGAAGGMVPFAGAARAMSGMGGVAGAGGQAMLDPFISAPGRAIATELAAGAGAGAGVDIAQNVAPGNPYAEITAALLGGTAAGVGPTAVSAGVQRLPLVSGATRFVQGEIAPFTDAGAMERARRRMAGLVENPEAASAALDQPTIGGLSPAVQTGERRLMALEQTVRDTDPVFDMLARQQEMDSGQLLREALVAPAEGANSLAARGFFENRVGEGIDSINQSLDAALGQPIGVQRVSTALREQSAPVRQEAYDAAYAQPIDYSSEAGQTLEQLIARAEQAAPGTIGLANRMMAGEGVQSNQIMANVGPDGSVTFQSMPDTRQIDYITRALNQMARSGEGQGALGGQTDIGRILSNLSGQMRSALREANPSYAEALQTAATPIGQRQALLLGQELLSPSLPRDLAQEQLAGMTEPELAFVRQGVRSQIDEVLANVRASLSNPEIGMQQAQQALRQLSAPAVREKISLILPEDAASDLFERIDNASMLLDPRRSGVALFAGARPQEEIRSIFNAPDPARAAAQLVSEAQGNPQALAGVKGAFLDELMQRARTGNYDDTGEPVLSGRALTNALNNNRVMSVANQILSMEERSRLSQIIDEFTRIETAQGRLPSIGSVMEGEPNSLVALIARTIAARQGARAGQGTSGASLLTANFASQRMNRLLEGLTLDRAEKLIREAIAGDRELFQALLAPNGRVTPAQENALANAIARTAVGVGGASQALGGEEENEIAALLGSSAPAPDPVALALTQ